MSVQMGYRRASKIRFAKSHGERPSTNTVFFNHPLA